MQQTSRDNGDTPSEGENIPTMTNFSSEPVDNEESEHTASYILLIRIGWYFQRYNIEEVAQFFTDMGLQELLTGNKYEQHQERTKSSTQNDEECVQKRKGWQRPGPGPKKGNLRVPRASHLHTPIMIGLLHLMQGAVHHEQFHYRSYVQERSSELLINSQRLEALSTMEEENKCSEAMKRKIWALAPQMGIPGIITKLLSAPHAMAIYLPRDRNVSQWWCTLYNGPEIHGLSMCPQRPSKTLR